MDHEIGAQSCWVNGSCHIFLGTGKFSLWASWVEIGLANAGTATEQLVGLGIPALSLPGKGPQFKRSFASRQSRLLGGAVMPCRSPDIFVENLEALLNDDLLRQSRGDCWIQKNGI